MVLPLAGDRQDRKWPLPGDPDASVGARHHRVPRFYLERFANERMQIGTVDRRTGVRRTTAIRETAAEKDFYTAINTEGEKDGKTEHLLSHIEGSAAQSYQAHIKEKLSLRSARELVQHAIQWSLDEKP